MQGLLNYFIYAVNTSHNQLKSNIYPIWHLVNIGSSMMIIEYDNGKYNAACHHEHDAIEICPWIRGIVEKFPEKRGRAISLRNGKKSLMILKDERLLVLYHIYIVFFSRSLYYFNFISELIIVSMIHNNLS